MTETETRFEQKGKKRRRNVYFTRELEAAADELKPRDVSFSRWAERVLWRELVRNHGEADVLDAVENAQSDMDDDVLLSEADRESYTITA